MVKSSALYCGHSTTISSAGVVTPTLAANISTSNEDIIYRFSGKLSKAQIHPSSARNGDVIWNTRINGVIGNIIIIHPANNSGGYFEDITNEDEFVEGDNLDWSVNVGGTSGSIIFNQYGVLCVSDKSRTQHGCSTGGVGDAPRFSPLNGNVGGWATTEAASKQVSKYACVLRGFYMLANSTPTSPTCVFKTRVNGVDGNQTISVPPGPVLENNYYEDITNTDEISANDEFNVTMSSGTAIATPLYGVQMETNNDKSLMAISDRIGISQSISITRFYAYGVNLGFPGEGIILKCHSNPPLIMDKMTIRVLVNGTTASSTLDSRIDDNNGNLHIFIASGALGLFEDITNTDEILFGSEYNMKLSTGNGSSGITFSSFGAWAEYNAGSIGGGNQGHIIG